MLMIDHISGIIFDFPICDIWGFIFLCKVNHFDDQRNNCIFFPDKAEYLFFFYVEFDLVLCTWQIPKNWKMNTFVRIAAWLINCQTVDTK